MLKDLMRNQGVTDCLAKFAISTEDMKAMHLAYGHLPPEQQNKLIRDRMARDDARSPQLPPNFNALLATHNGDRPGLSAEDTNVQRGPSAVPKVAPAPVTAPGMTPKITAPSFMPAAGPIMPAAPTANTVVARNPVSLRRPR